MAPFVSFQGHSFSFLNPRFLLPQHAWWPRESPHTSLSRSLSRSRAFHHLLSLPPLALPPSATGRSLLGKTSLLFTSRSPHMTSPFALCRLAPSDTRHCSTSSPTSNIRRASPPHTSAFIMLFFLMLSAHVESSFISQNITIVLVS